ncbi:protein of unknown function [Ruminococcaceae bacterium BL-4]|nr:protein of unknown function [Ruminococcaceae bacterium BL-4]
MIAIFKAYIFSGGEKDEAFPEKQINYFSFGSLLYRAFNVDLLFLSSSSQTCSGKSRP